MAGSLEKSEHKYFEQIADYLSTNKNSDNVIWILEHDTNVNEAKSLYIRQRTMRKYSIQVPSLQWEKNQQQSVKYQNRLSRFFWDPSQNEQENFINLDVEHTNAYFVKDYEKDQEQLIEFLKSMKFDLGIGGHYYADSLLFRALNISYLKIFPEDIESYTMQFKFNMPVLLSSYPSSYAVANFQNEDMPTYDSQRYRFQMIKGYEYNRFIAKPFLYMNNIKKALPQKYHEKLLDYDQDYAMFIGEGTRVGLFQSIMMKPPNIAPVYPLRDESLSKRAKIDLPQSQNKKGPVIIFNTELQDPKSLLFRNSQSYFYKILNQLKDLKRVFKNDDFDIVILYDKKSSYQVLNAIKSFERQPITLEVNDPFNIQYSESTQQLVADNQRQSIWISQCTQQNFLAAIEKFNAPIIGYANEEMSNTQIYNCQKLKMFNVGDILTLEMLDDSIQDHSRNLQKIVGKLSDKKDSNFNDLIHNVTFHKRLLSEDERISKMDLEYWIDYVFLFGVDDFIPLYDKLDFITFRNWDVYAIYLLLIYSFFYIVLKLFSICKKFTKKVQKEKEN